MPKILTSFAFFVCSVAVLIGASQDYGRDITASTWHELGPNSATLGGVSQDALGAMGGPALAVNAANGDIYAAWASGNDEIYVKRWDGTAWSEAGAGSATGGGISDSPALISELPQLSVRASDGHVFVVWRELASDFTGGDIFAAEFDGSSWQRLGPNNGRVSDVSQGTDTNAASASDPQIILSSVVATSDMPIVAWRLLVRVGNGHAIYVKRWTGVAWVEMGAGSASVYQLPHTNVFNPATSTWTLGDFTNARGINADDNTFDRLYPLPVLAGGPGIFSETGNHHVRSSSPRLILNNFGRPAVVFLNGSSRNNIEQYPHNLHVRSFTGDNSLPAYLAWEEFGRVASGQSSVGYTASDGDLSATWGENGTAGLYLATTLYPSAAPLNRPRVLRVLQFVGTSWTPVGPDVGSGAAFGYQPSLTKDSTGRPVISWTVGDGSDVYVSALGNDALGIPIWTEVGAGSASGPGVSANQSSSGNSDLVVDSRSGTDAFAVGWYDGADPTDSTPQIYVRGTRPPGGGGQVPGPPTGLTATATGSSITLSWAAPTAGGAPTTYVLEVGHAPGLASLANFATGSTGTTFSATAVPNGTYYVRVRAANGMGTSGPSNEATLVVGPVQGITPSAPTGLTASSLGNTVTLSWLATTNGGTPTTYRIEAGSAPGLANLADFFTGSTATTFSASGVGSGTYYVRVRAANSAGSSGPSNEVTLVVGSSIPGVPLAPSDLQASWVASTVTLTWVTPSGGAAPTSYVVEVGSRTGLTDLASFLTGGTATTLTATDVGDGTYYVRVRAANAVGMSGPSNEVIVEVGADSAGLTPANTKR